MNNERDATSSVHGHNKDKDGLALNKSESTNENVEDVISSDTNCDQNAGIIDAASDGEGLHSKTENNGVQNDDKSSTSANQNVTMGDDERSDRDTQQIHNEEKVIERENNSRGNVTVTNGRLRRPRATRRDYATLHKYGDVQLSQIEQLMLTKVYKPNRTKERTKGPRKKTTTLEMNQKDMF